MASVTSIKTRTSTQSTSAIQTHENSQPQLVFKRYEAKYLLDADQRARLERTMKGHMVPDEYGPSTVCNVYYDTPTLLLARRSADHPYYREKIRCRSYGKNDGHSPVFVELKKKCGGVVYKRRCSLGPRQARALLSGARVPQGPVESEIAYACKRYEKLQPTVFIAYDRVAYYAPENHDFRMTFDDRVRARWDHVSLSAGDGGTQISPKGITILEVKTMGGMPRWLVDFLNEEGLRQANFSKYGTACRLHLEAQAQSGTTAR